MSPCFFLAGLLTAGRCFHNNIGKMCGPYTEGNGLSTTNITLLSLSLANTRIPMLASLLMPHHCSSCESMSHGLHIVAKHYQATNYQKLCFYLQCEQNYETMKYTTNFYNYQSIYSIKTMQS